jgi:hypothetical protein
MKRLHIHVAVSNLANAVGFYSDLFKKSPCCAGTNFANWHVHDPPINFAASIAPGRTGALHLGFEVDTSEDLHKIDRVLQGSFRSSAILPWEVSLRKPIIRKESEL